MQGAVSDGSNPTRCKSWSWRPFSSRAEMFQFCWSLVPAACSISAKRCSTVFSLTLRPECVDLRALLGLYSKSVSLMYPGPKPLSVLFRAGCCQCCTCIYQVSASAGYVMKQLFARWFVLYNIMLKVYVYILFIIDQRYMYDRCEVQIWTEA